MDVTVRTFVSINIYFFVQIKIADLTCSYVGMRIGIYI